MARYYTAYSKSIRYLYKANLKSNVTVFLVFNFLFCFVLPFILAYNSSGFWIRQNSFKEQPTVRFKYQYLFILESELLNSHVSIICTSYQNLDCSQVLSDNCSLLKVLETDENNDGKNDRMKISIHLTNVTTYDITTVHLFLIFDYKIHSECILSTEAMASASYTFSRPIGKLDIISELNTDIKRPIECYTRHVKRNESSIISVFSTRVNKINAVHEMLLKYVSKNVNVNLKNLHHTKRFKTEVAENEPFIITADIQYTEQNIIYKTQFWQLIKWAWVQYFSITALFIVLSRKIKRFVFLNRVLQTIKISPFEST